jgi:hypothetical protein
MSRVDDILFGGLMGVGTSTDAAEPARSTGSTADIDEIVSRYSKQYGVDSNLSKALISQESGGKYAVSGAGARGWAQIMPDTDKAIAAELGEKYSRNDARDPETNIRRGIYYLSQNLKKFGGREDLAAAAYHAGPGAVEKAGGKVPNTYDEAAGIGTPDYVKSILNRKKHIERSDFFLGKSTVRPRFDNADDILFGDLVDLPEITKPASVEKPVDQEPKFGPENLLVEKPVIPEIPISSRTGDYVPKPGDIKLDFAGYGEPQKVKQPQGEEGLTGEQTVSIAGKTVAKSYADLGRFAFEAGRIFPEGSALFYDAIGMVPGKPGEWGKRMAEGARQLSQESSEMGKQASEFWNYTDDEQRALEKAGIEGAVVVGVAQLAAFLPQMLAGGGELQGAKVLGGFVKKYGKQALSEAVPILEKAINPESAKALGNILVGMEIEGAKGYAEGGVAEGAKRAVETGAMFAAGGAVGKAVEPMVKGAPGIIRQAAHRTAQAGVMAGEVAATGGSTADIIVGGGMGLAMGGPGKGTRPRSQAGRSQEAPLPATTFKPGDPVDYIQDGVQIGAGNTFVRSFKNKNGESKVELKDIDGQNFIVDSYEAKAPASTIKPEPSGLTPEDIALNRSLKERLMAEAAVETGKPELSEHEKIVKELEKNREEIKTWEKSVGNDYIWTDGLPVEESGYVKRGGPEEQRYRSELAARRSAEATAGEGGLDKSAFGISKTVPRGTPPAEQRAAVPAEARAAAGTAPGTPSPAIGEGSPAPSGTRTVPVKLKKPPRNWRNEVIAKTKDLDVIDNGDGTTGDREWSAAFAQYELRRDYNKLFHGNLKGRGGVTGRTTEAPTEQAYQWLQQKAEQLNNSENASTRDLLGLPETVHPDDVRGLISGAHNTEADLLRFADQRRRALNPDEAIEPAPWDLPSDNPERIAVENGIEYKGQGETGHHEFFDPITGGNLTDVNPTAIPGKLAKMRAEFEAQKPKEPTNEPEMQGQGRKEEVRFSEETGTLPGFEDTRRPWEIEQARIEQFRKDRQRENPLENTMFDQNAEEAKRADQGDLFAGEKPPENVIPFPKREEGFESQVGAVGGEEPARVKVTGNRSGTAEAEAMFKKQKEDVKKHFKKSFEDIFDELASKTADVSYPIKRRLRKDQRVQAHSVIMAYDKIKGANSESTAQLREAEKVVYSNLPRKYDEFFGDFLQANRTIEVEGLKTPEGTPRNIKSTGNVGASKLNDWLADIKDQDMRGYAAMKTASKKYYDIMFDQLDQLVSDGSITKKLADDLKANHKHYSKRKFIQHIDPETSSADASGNSVNAPDSGLKTLGEGSEQAMVNNPRYLMAEVIARTQSRIAKNRANKAMYKYISENPDNALGGKVLVNRPPRKEDLMGKADNLGSEKARLEDRLKIPLKQEEFISLEEKKKDIQREIRKLRKESKTEGPGTASDNLLSLIRKKIDAEVQIFEAQKALNKQSKLTESEKIELEDLLEKLDDVERRKVKGYQFEVEKLANESDAIDKKIGDMLSPDIPASISRKYSSAVRGIKREQPIQKLESDIWAIDEKINNPLDAIQKRDIEEKITGIDKKISDISEQIKDVEKSGGKQKTNEIYHGEDMSWNREFTAWIDGEKKTFVLPRKVAKYWVTSDPQISKMTAAVLDWGLGGKILRPMATGYNPEFAVANLPRDMLHSWIATREYSSFLPVAIAQQVKDMIKVAPDVLLRKGRLRQYTKEGGGMEFLTQQGYVNRSRPWESPSATGEQLRQAQGILGYLGESSEMLMRLAIRERAIKNGKSPEEATWVARNYIDFSQGGSMAKAVDRAVPYFNASIQATRGVVRAFSEDPKRATFQVAQLVALGAGLAIVNTQTRKEVWDEISEREKESKFIIALPWKYTDKNGSERRAYLGIAKDQGQRVFATIGEVIADRAMGNITGDVAFKRVKTAVSDFIPVDAANILPPNVSAFIGYINNKDFWTHEPFWRGPDVKPTDEYWKTTPKVYKDISKVTGLSPERMKGAIGKVVTKNIYTDLVTAGWEEMTKGLSNEERESLDKTALEQVSNIPGARRVLRVTNPKTTEITLKEEVKDVVLSGNRKSIDRYDRASEYLKKFKEKPARSAYSDYFRSEVALAREAGEKPNRASIKRTYDAALANRFLKGRDLTVYKAKTVAERAALVEKTLDEQSLTGKKREREKYRLMNKKAILRGDKSEESNPQIF